MNERLVGSAGALPFRGVISALIERDEVHLAVVEEVREAAAEALLGQGDIAGDLVIRRLQYYSLGPGFHLRLLIGRIGRRLELEPTMPGQGRRDRTGNRWHEPRGGQRRRTIGHDRREIGEALEAADRAEDLQIGGVRLPCRRSSPPRSARRRGRASGAASRRRRGSAPVGCAGDPPIKPATGLFAAAITDGSGIPTTSLDIQTLTALAAGRYEAKDPAWERLQHCLTPELGVLDRGPCL